MPADFDTSDCFVVEGKLALPYTYFAGKVGSKFITTLRDEKKILGVRCKTCNKIFVPPRQTCALCLEDLGDGWVELKNEGEVTNYTVVRYEESAADRIGGRASEFCGVAVRRRHWKDMNLEIQGEEARRFIEIVQTYAGPPGPGRRPKSESQNRYGGVTGS